MSVFKPALADALIAVLSPIRKRYQELSEDQEYVQSVMADGAEKSTDEARERMVLIKTVMGLLGFSVGRNTPIIKHKKRLL